MVQVAYLSIDVRRETSWHTEGVDKGLDTLGRHRVFGVESGDTTLHVEGSKKGRSTMTRLDVSSVHTEQGAQKLTPVRKTN
jgi:hypothetical protein